MTSSELPYVTGPSGADLWAEYAADPDRHPLIPNCSPAGYGRGERPIPEVEPVVAAADFGAVGDGRTDNTAALAAAVDRAAELGGGAVVLAPGAYRLSGMLHLRHSGVVLRGSGRDQTELIFAQPLASIIGPRIFDEPPTRSVYGWAGGLVWIGPEVAPTTSNWEPWPAGETLAAADGAARAGDGAVPVDAAGAARLREHGIGATVVLAWDNVADRSLLERIAGHPRMRDFDWDRFGAMLLRTPTWRWPVDIAAVADDRASLAQPLRVDVDPRWNVRFEALPDHVREVGVEHLALRMLNNEPTDRHLQDVGYNGIYLHRAVNCWVRDVRVHDAQNGVIMAAAKNTTVADLALTGRRMHHATATRVASHDNLITGFSLDAETMHGINTEGLSSGNVWRDGVMAHGTFDSHKQMSFDSIRTNITVRRNDGKPGGSRDAGPFLGQRVVHWNVRLAGASHAVYQPDCISNGALVGISGMPLSTQLCGHSMVPGFTGCVVADDGRVPDPPDLYVAQLALGRHGPSGRPQSRGR